MAKTTFSQVDEYGFERSETFDYETYESFMSEYLRVLTRRNKKWQDMHEHDKRKKSSKLKRYVRKGIPISQRADVWLYISGASDIIQNDQLSHFYAGLKRNITNNTITEMIEIDLPRTFPDNIYFNKDDTLPQQLYNVLATFAMQNKDVGYCQGLNYIAGLLLLVTKNEEKSFWLLKVLIENILPKYYIKSMSGLITDLEVLDELVRVREPAVYRHIKSVGMPWAVTTTKWFICLYAEVLPTETVLRIWDCLFYEGSKIIFRVALTLIRLHKNEILKAKELGEMVACFKAMHSSPKVINCHEFMENIFKLPGSLSNSYIEKLRRKHANATL